MSKPKLNEPDVETTTTIGIFSKNINQSMDIIVDKNGFAIPQTKSHTLEEIKKEWEELGFYMVKTSATLIDLLNVEEMSIIKIDNKNKRYIKVDSVLYTNFIPITFQEHQLLTKTFRMWGWL